MNVNVDPSERKNQNPNCIAEEECIPFLRSVMPIVRHRAKVKESIAGAITSDNGFSYTSDIEWFHISLRFTIRAQIDKTRSNDWRMNRRIRIQVHFVGPLLARLALGCFQSYSLKGINNHKNKEGTYTRTVEWKHFVKEYRFS